MSWPSTRSRPAPRRCRSARYLPAASASRWRLGDAVVRTAVQVSATPRRCLRYGFVADYRPDRDVGEVVEHARRLHLTAVQCYDWAYRHADLLGGGEQYDDPLGNARLAGDRATPGRGPRGGRSGDARVRRGVRRRRGRVAAAGAIWRCSRPTERPTRSETSSPSSTRPRRSGSTTSSTTSPARLASVGFDGFHLDQYGYPRRAVRHDGTRVDVAASFVSVIEAARAGLPDEPPRLQQRQRLPDRGAPPRSPRTPCTSRRGRRTSRSARSRRW